MFEFRIPPALGALVWPTLTTWFFVVSGWIVGGTLLLVAGWIGLSRGDRRASPRPRPGWGAVPRILGAGPLAVLAAWVGVGAVSLALHPVGPWGLLAAASHALGAWESNPGDWFAAAVALGVGGIAGWLSSSTRWSASGLAAWLGLALLASGFLGYAALILADATTPFALGLGGFIVLVEAFGLFLMLTYQFYALEDLAGAPPQIPRTPAGATEPPYVPFVAIQVACFNEPLHVVTASLESIVRLDYPRDRRLVQLLDDSTDPDLVRELGVFCRAHGIDFHHREHRRGFKAGALNDGRRSLPPHVDLIAIIDADYVVAPDFLTQAVVHFRHPRVGYVQSPQGYRNVGGTEHGRRYALADAYFYHVVQPVRARFQSAIFCGTMGLVRRTSLDEVGGWSEACVTEDAELSIRLLSAGWRVVYLRRAFGHGLAPLTMDGVRSQHRRWAFGGVQMLRLDRRRLASPHLTGRQRADFWIGGMFWSDGIFFFGMAMALATVAIGSWFGLSLPSPSTAALALTACAPLLLLWDGILKVRLGLRRFRPTTYRDVLGVMAFWYAVKVNDLRAALRAISGGSLTFVRTPKAGSGHRGRTRAVAHAVGATKLETSLALALVAVDAVTLYRALVERAAPLTLAGALLTIWVAYYAVTLLAAPMIDYSSQRRPASFASSVHPAPSNAARRPAEGPGPA